MKLENPLLFFIALGVGAPLAKLGADWSELLKLELCVLPYSDRGGVSRSIEGRSTAAALDEVRSREGRKRLREGVLA